MPANTSTILSLLRTQDTSAENDSSFNLNQIMKLTSKELLAVIKESTTLKEFCLTHQQVVKKMVTEADVELLLGLTDHQLSTILVTRQLVAKMFADQNNIKLIFNEFEALLDRVEKLQNSSSPSREEPVYKSAGCVVFVLGLLFVGVGLVLYLQNNDNTPNTPYIGIGGMVLGGLLCAGSCMSCFMQCYNETAQKNKSEQQLTSDIRSYFENLGIFAKREIVDVEAQIYAANSLEGKKALTETSSLLSLQYQGI